jgi:hypothetical protein
MNKDKIFIRFQEPIKISKAITNINIQNKTTQKYNEKVQAYMTIKANQFIQYHNKALAFDKYEIYTLPYLPKYIFIVITTKTNTNHPYLLFVNLDDKYLNFLIPFGKEKKQADIDDYAEAIDECTIPELLAIYILIEKSIYIRKTGVLISDQFKLLNCNNITNCVKHRNIIMKKRIPEQEKQNILSKYNEYYLNRAVGLLKIYFNLLESKNFEEAYLFLKGNNSKKYFGKERLNTFFKNTKSIMGHLEIFITLYELFFKVRMKLFKN